MSEKAKQRIDKAVDELIASTIRGLRSELAEARNLIQAEVDRHNEPGGAPDENWRPCNCEFCNGAAAMAQQKEGEK